MGVQYAPRGLIGVLTPQANPTVEPEFMILCPPGHAVVTARLTSTRPTIDERLADYLVTVESTIDRFANAPIAALAFACTGASYLVGIDAERDMLRRIGEARGVPFLTAANAIGDALAALGAVRIGVVSPYDGALHESCIAYWASRGVHLAAVSRLGNRDDSFHPIYSLHTDAAAGGLAAIDPETVEAVVMLGTGLATLPAIRAAAAFGKPVLSSNLALMWRAVAAATGAAPDRESLRPWLAGTGWGERLERHMSAP